MGIVPWLEVQGRVNARFFTRAGRWVYLILKGGYSYNAVAERRR